MGPNFDNASMSISSRLEIEGHESAIASGEPMPMGGFNELQRINEPLRINDPAGVGFLPGLTTGIQPSLITQGQPHPESTTPNVDLRQQAIMWDRVPPRIPTLMESTPQHVGLVMKHGLV